jgi:hypothetical protein
LDFSFACRAVRIPVYELPATFTEVLAAFAGRLSSFLIWIAIRETVARLTPNALFSVAAVQVHGIASDDHGYSYHALSGIQHGVDSSKRTLIINSPM